MKKYKIVNKLRFTICLLVIIALIIIPVVLIFVKSHSSIKAYNQSVNDIKNKDIQVQSTNQAKFSESNPQTHSPEIIEPVHSQVNNSGRFNSFIKSRPIIYAGAPSKKQVALTFDDGPDNYYTDKILDILKQYNIKATFFVIGENAKAYPKTLKRIASEGDIIGNHTYDHADLNRLNNDQVRSEITKTETVLDSIIGHHSAIMRPPYGLNSIQTIKIISDMGYKIIDWSVDTRDWAGTPPSKIMKYVLKETHPGAIILHHCSAGKVKGLANTIKILPNEISTLKSKGYKFVTIPELLNESN